MYVVLCTVWAHWAETESLLHDAISASVFFFSKRDCFPIIHTLLKILSIHPVSTTKVLLFEEIKNMDGKLHDRKSNLWASSHGDGQEEGKFGRNT